ncbi:MAG TPA: cupredoxin domain-containing protein [Candidatus Saccharimonadales bacterium]
MESKNNAVAWIVGVVVVLALGGVVAYALTMNKDDKTDQTVGTTDTQETSKNEKPVEEEASKTDDVIIRFTGKGTGFEPNSYDVKKGQKVTVKNESNQPVQFSSDDHPAHTDETELNLPVLQPGESASFTPSRVGEWGFHDHLNDNFVGLLKVTE